MPDIFISYSSKDRSEAIRLSEQLGSKGLSTWIDSEGIVGAEQWTSEIVQGIQACSTFLLLLSPDSVTSGNVLRELTLAAEKNKRILPVALSEVQPPPAIEYLIAGLQRVAATDIPAIVRSHSYGVERMRAKDERKSLIILPFEDLSPSQDNRWFADGLTGELIDMLGKIKSLRILDRKSSLDLRDVKMTTVQLGKEFDTRFFIEGTVRKFSEQIKISISLLDIESGDHLWQESYKGEMKDIFDLQESVASKVVKGLKLHLTKEEKSRLEERGTENTEAYELFMRGKEYGIRETKEGIRLAIELYSEALRLDPNYVQAYGSKALALANLYRGYDRNPALLMEAEQLIDEARLRKPDDLGLYTPAINILIHRGKLEEAERAAQERIEKEPENFYNHYVLGFFYMETGQRAKAIAPFENAIHLKPDHLQSLANVLSCCDSSGEAEKCAYWASVALPLVEKHLRLHPDDEWWRVWRAHVLHWAGRDSEALAAVREIADTSSPRQVRDGNPLFNAACLFANLGEKAEALRVFRRAINAGYRNFEDIQGLLLANEGFASLTSTPEFSDVKRMVEEIEAEAKKN